MLKVISDIQDVVKRYRDTDETLLKYFIDSIDRCMHVYDTEAIETAIHNYETLLNQLLKGLKDSYVAMQKYVMSARKDVILQLFTSETLGERLAGFLFDSSSASDPKLDLWHAVSDLRAAIVTDIAADAALRHAAHSLAQISQVEKHVEHRS